MAVCIESGQSLKWCGDIRGSGPVLDGFGHGAYHVCQHTWFVFLEKSRPWIIKVDDDGL